MKISEKQSDLDGRGDSSRPKEQFAEPRLRSIFIEPKLTKHGDAAKITFSNPFSPVPN